MNKIIKNLFFVYMLFVFVSSSAQTALNVIENTITVSDIDKNLAFYTDNLKFEVQDTIEIKPETASKLFNISQAEAQNKAIRLRLGNEHLILQKFLNANGKPIPKDSKSNDLWFQHIAIVVSDMDKAYGILAKNRVQHVSTSPQTLPDYITAAAGIKAFYFRDPDNHNLEIIYFPKDKGNPKWQNKTSNVFLGIDHTAIGISNTPESQKFYETLGLKLAGKSENYGKEQEHLNQVFGARLEISGFVAQKGIGVEFLDYIAPPGGRAYPSESKPTDLWHWHTTIEVNHLEDLHQKLIELDIEIISRSIVDLSESYLKAQKALMVRDPDGHAILLIEK